MPSLSELYAIKIIYQQQKIEYVVNVWYITQPSAVAAKVLVSHIKVLILFSILLTLDSLKRISIAWNAFSISTLEQTWYNDRLCFWGETALLTLSVNLNNRMIVVCSSRVLKLSAFYLSQPHSSFTELYHRLYSLCAYVSITLMIYYEG